MLCRRLSFAGLMLAMLAQTVPGDNRPVAMQGAAPIVKIQYRFTAGSTDRITNNFFLNANPFAHIRPLCLHRYGKLFPAAGIDEPMRGAMMLIPKNVGPKERVARIVAGLAMVLCGLLWLGWTPLGIAVAVAGGASVVSGLIRYCPACAIAGKGASGNCRDGA